MNQLKFTTPVLMMLSLVLGLSSCKKDRMPVINSVPTGTIGVYALNEGNYGVVNNSSITYYDIAKGTSVANYFKAQNNIDLGTDASDLQQYGSKMYCVVTGANATLNDSYIEVISLATGKSVKRIPFYDGSSDFSARHIAFYKNKAYVSSYDGYITKIDTASLTIDSRLKVGGALESVVVISAKLYATNTSHSLFPSANNNTVAVVDLNSFTKMPDIPVSFNPTKIVATANGDLFTITNPYVAPTLDKLSSVTNTMLQSYNLNLMTMIANNNNVYVITGDYPVPAIKHLNTSSGTLGADVITDGSAVITPYGINVNPVDGNIYIQDANNYGAVGKVLVFNDKGIKKFEFTTGPSPSMVVFNYSYK